MSGILGEGLLGDFILGDEGEGSSTFAYGQAQAYIIAINIEGVGQAQADILQVYFGFAQAQADIQQTYQGFAQAQALIVVTSYGFGQAQGTILQVYNAFAQAQADILQTYFGFGQAQTFITTGANGYGQAQADILQIYQGYGQSQGQIKQTYYGYAQAQATLLAWAFGQSQANILQVYQGYAQTKADILQTYNSFAQAQALIILTFQEFAQAQALILGWVFGQAQGYIYNPYLLAQAQGNIRRVLFPSAQAQAYIKERPVGQAQALIDSSIKNQTGQAQAFICWIDTFTRSTFFGLGSDYTWVNFDTDFGAPEESTYLVDGSKVVDTNGIDEFVDSYQLNRVVPRDGSISFEFTTNSTLVSISPFIAIVFGNNGYENKHSFGVYISGSQWYLTSSWSTQSTATDVPITINPSTTYRVKARYADNGRLNAKIWNIVDSEPDWMLAGSISNFESSNQIWLDLLFTEDIASFDNLVICTYDDKPFEPLQGYAQAGAYIYRPQGYGQAQASITNTTANGAAQAYIAWTSVESPFTDTFTRTTNRGLGAPHYLWTNEASSVDHPAATTLYINGTKVVIPGGIQDSYYLGYTFKMHNLLTFEVTIDAIEPFDIRLEVAGSPERSFRFLYTGTGNFDYTTYLGTTLAGGSGLTPEIATFKFENVFSPVVSSTRFYKNGIFIGSGSSSGSGNHLGNTNLRLKFSNTGSTDVKFDNLYLDSGTWRHAQARAKINAQPKKHAQAQAFIGHFKRGQAQARIKQTYQKHAQVQALLNTGLKTGQAQAFIGDMLHVAYAQAQAHIFRRLSVCGQAQARIKVNRWTWGQAQAYIKHGQAFGQAKALITKYSISRLGQAQAQISIPEGFGQAQAIIFVGANNVCGQAQASIGFRQRYAQAQALIFGGYRIRPAQAQAYIAAKVYSLIAQAMGYIKSTLSAGRGQAQAQIVGSTNRYGQARAFIKRTIAYGQAQAFIFQSLAGNLVKYNGYLLPGYLQSEELSSGMRMNITGTIYGETYNEYIGLENKLLSLRMKVVQTNYRAAKDKVMLAGTMVRSNRDEFVQLTVIDTSKYYLAKTKKITLGQSASASEYAADYTAEFEVKPWKYGELHSITGTTLLDTNDVSRTIGNGTWTPATIIVTGNDITISGYTESSEFTGFVSISGAVSNLEIDTENYIALMAGQDRNDLMNLDYRLYVGPGRTLFAVNGATSAEIIYQDRWDL